MPPHPQYCTSPRSTWHLLCVDEPGCEVVDHIGECPHRVVLAPDVYLFPVEVEHPVVGGQACPHPVYGWHYRYTLSFDPRCACHVSPLPGSALRYSRSLSGSPRPP